MMKNWSLSDEKKKEKVQGEEKQVTREDEVKVRVRCHRCKTM